MCLHVFGKALVYLLDTVVLVKRKKIIEHYYVPITFAYNHIGTICGGELDPMQKPKFREISQSAQKLLLVFLRTQIRHIVAERSQGDIGRHAVILLFLGPGGHGRLDVCRLALASNQIGKLLYFTWLEYLLKCQAFFFCNRPLASINI